MQFRGTPLGEAAAPLKRRDTEPVLYPDAFDKFAGGELQAILSGAGTENLIVVGSLTNVAVLYTSTAAARVHRYNVIIPLDGVNANSTYEHEYAIHQLGIRDPCRRRRPHAVHPARHDRARVVPADRLPFTGPGASPVPFRILCIQNAQFDVGRSLEFVVTPSCDVVAAAYP